MVEAALADDLATAVREAPVPEDAFTAERSLAALLSTRLPVLEQAPFTDRARCGAAPRPARGGAGAGAAAGDRRARVGRAEAGAGDLARAVLHLVADRPGLFRGRPGYALGIPVDSMTGILEEAQRYLAWLGAQGPIGTVHQHEYSRCLCPDWGERRLLRRVRPRAGAPGASACG